MAQGWSDTGILLTGATGLVGGELVGRLLRAAPEATLYCLIRARDAADLERRRRELLSWAEVGPTDEKRVVAVAGDVWAPDLGLGSQYDRLTQNVSAIVHTAASTHLNMELNEALRRNSGAATHVVDFALRALDAGGLSRLHHFSTCYVVGDQPGVVGVDAADGLAPFRNTYEQSKWEAEQVVRSAAARLPVTVYRPSIIVGDSRSGRTPHFRVLYEPMKWIFYGKTDILPCRPEIRVDVVPVDYVCDALIALGGDPDTIGHVYHLSANEDRCCSIGDLIDLSVPATNEWLRERSKPEITRPRVVSPDEAGEELAEIFELGAAVMRTHVPYMLVEQLFDDRETRAALPEEISCPHLADYLATLLHYSLEYHVGD